MTEHDAQGARPVRARKGRPPSSLTARRSVPLRVWATHGERQAIAARADRARLTVAEFMRRAALGRAVNVVEVPAVNVETRRELAALGHQMNRIVRAVEAAGPDAIPADLRDLLDAVRARADEVAMALATGLPEAAPPTLEVTSRGVGPP